MFLAGFQKTSLVDWPGQICATVFFAGCNFRCPFCHNPELVLQDEIDQLPKISFDDFIVELHKRKSLIDGVCITGGEPLLNPDLTKLITRIKKLDLKVKLDTNGTNPKLLKQLIDKQLVDYIAMDMKSPLSKYGETTASKINVDVIKQSIKLIIDSGIEHEFRTTMFPAFVKPEDLVPMAKELEGAQAFYLQQFSFDRKILDPAYEPVKPYTPEQLKEMLKKIEPLFKSSGIRGI